MKRQGSGEKRDRREVEKLRSKAGRRRVEEKEKRREE
jgi:hypothetical protein